MRRGRRSAAVAVAGACLASAVVGLGLLAAPPERAAAQASPISPTHRSNPAIADDFPDPFVLRADGGYYAYATHRGLANVQIARSLDLVNWQSVGTALPVLPVWATGPQVWAPSVYARSGHHVLYYAVRERASGLFCISAARSTLATGPFLDESSQPLVCQRERGGSIDPSPFVDVDGRAHLLFKSEGIAGREPTRLWSQALAEDGMSLVGEPVELLHSELAWEHPIIENPAMVRADGRYHLLYSAGRWQEPTYSTGWAICESPAGPCERGSAEPILRSRGWALGPGGADFFVDHEGDTWIAYHAWRGPAVGYPQGTRTLMLDRITFADGRPWLDGPTTDWVAFDVEPGPPVVDEPPRPPVGASAGATATAAAPATPAPPSPARPAPTPNATRPVKPTTAADRAILDAWRAVALPDAVPSTADPSPVHRADVVVAERGDPPGRRPLRAGLGAATGALLLGVGATAARRLRHGLPRSGEPFVGSRA